jgi:LysR family transcriptional regulator, transcriptional activator for dmlA
VLVATPTYLGRRGVPLTLKDLATHDCLVVRENGLGPGDRFDHWRLWSTQDQQTHHVAVQGPLSSNSGEMVRDWCLNHHGIMLRSLWDVAPQLASGELVQVLPDHAMPDADIHWLAPYRAQVPHRIRLLKDHLLQQFQEEPWKLRSRQYKAAPSTSSSPQWPQRRAESACRAMSCHPASAPAPTRPSRPQSQRSNEWFRFRSKPEAG